MEKIKTYNVLNNTSKFHYEYLLRCIDLCNGGMTKTGFKNYQEAAQTLKCLSGHWKIEKFRVYNS